MPQINAARHQILAHDLFGRAHQMGALVIDQNLSHLITKEKRCGNAFTQSQRRFSNIPNDVTGLLAHIQAFSEFDRCADCVRGIQRIVRQAICDRSMLDRHMTGVVAA